MFTETKAVIDTSENKQIFYSPRTKKPLHAMCSAKLSPLFIEVYKLVGNRDENPTLHIGPAPAFAMLPPCWPPPPLTP